MFTGASFTAVTLIVEVTVFELAALSFTVKLTVRALVDGLSELFEYCTALNAACHCATVAVFPAEDLWSNGAENKVHALLLCHPRTVDTLVVHGEVRVADGQLVGVDLPRLLEHHRKTAARIQERR